jgi:hypothetical protein
VHTGRANRRKVDKKIRGKNVRDFFELIGKITSLCYNFPTLGPLVLVVVVVCKDVKLMKCSDSRKGRVVFLCWIMLQVVNLKNDLVTLYQGD